MCMRSNSNLQARPTNSNYKKKKSNNSNNNIILQNHANKSYSSSPSSDAHIYVYISTYI